MAVADLERGDDRRGGLCRRDLEHAEAELRNRVAVVEIDQGRGGHSRKLPERSPPQTTARRVSPSSGGGRGADASEAMSERASPEQLRHPSALASAGRPFALLYRRWAVPRKLAAYGICLAAGPFLAGLFLLGSVRNRSFLIDFHYAFYPAGHAVAHGLSPYVPATELHAQRIPFVYPVVAAWLFAPFSLLPYTAAAAIYFALTLAALWGGLALLGIRDPRCYTVVCLWPAVLDDLQTGALGGAMLVALALVWRYRDRDGGPVALAVVVADQAVPVARWHVADPHPPVAGRRDRHRRRGGADRARHGRCSASQGWPPTPTCCAS